MNAKQRRLRFRRSARAAEAHNRWAEAQRESDPGMVERMRLLREYVADRKARGLASTDYDPQWEAARAGMLAVPLRPDPDRELWRRSVTKHPVTPLRRTAHITVPPSAENNHEGEYLVIELDASGKEISRRSRPLKGMRA